MTLAEKFGEPVAPAKSVAKTLDIGVELVEGLARDGKVRGYRIETLNGNVRWFIAKSEVTRLKAMMGRTAQ